MGWNTIYNFNSILLDGVKQHEFVYYVHSYYAALCNASIATTDYILPYSAMLQQDNFYGVQFHAEKSAKAGDKILLNFLQLT